MDSLQLMREASSKRAGAYNISFLAGISAFLVTVALLAPYIPKNDHGGATLTGAIIGTLVPPTVGGLVWLFLNQKLIAPAKVVESNTRTSWAKLHGLNPESVIPYIFNTSRGDFDFIDETVEGKLVAYRLKVDASGGVLYDGEGNRVDSKASAANMTGVTVDDPNSDLWKTASGTDD